MGKKEEPGFFLAEMTDHEPEDFPRFFQIAGLARNLLKMKQGGDKIGIVIQETGKFGLSFFIRMII